MAKKNYKKVRLTSSDLTEEKERQLYKILPEAFAEGRINWDKLKAVLGEKINDEREKFGFSWAGKSGAIRNVLTPSRATLKPNKKDSIKFDESENIFIEGDNLEALKLMQKAYFERIKMIYIDPPYNTGGDFVYRDNFHSPLTNYLEQTGQVDSSGNRLQTNTETSGRFHSDWLNMMYPRLKLAWNLLREDGVIFISIDDHEEHRLQMVMDEIFGEENFVGKLIWRKKEGGGQTDAYFVTEHEYLMVYSKSDLFQWIDESIPTDETKFNKEDEEGKFSAVKLAKWGSAARKEDRPKMYFSIKAPDGKNVYPKSPDGNDGRWRVGKARMDDLVKRSLIYWNKKNGEWIPYEKVYYSEEDVKTLKARSILFDVATTGDGANELKDIFGIKDMFENPKPTALIRFLLQHTTIDNDIVLDFFAGSGTTGHSVIEQNKEDGYNRNFILIQLPESLKERSVASKAGYKNIFDISMKRLKGVIQNNSGFKVFKLGKSCYRENSFEYDPDKSEEENKKALQEYLNKGKQDSLFDKAQDIDVVYENIIKEGLSLNSQINVSKAGKNKVFEVTDGERVINLCLDTKIDSTAVKEIIKNYKSKIFICLDNALNDTAKANLGLQVELKTI